VSARLAFSPYLLDRAQKLNVELEEVRVTGQLESQKYPLAATLNPEQLAE
jgi:hypothetical protein